MRLARQGPGTTASSGTPAPATPQAPAPTSNSRGGSNLRKRSPATSPNSSGGAAKGLRSRPMRLCMVHHHSKPHPLTRGQRSPEKGKGGRARACAKPAQLDARLVPKVAAVRETVHAAECGASGADLSMALPCRRGRKILKSLMSRRAPSKTRKPNTHTHTHWKCHPKAEQRTHVVTPPEHTTFGYMQGPNCRGPL